MSEHGSPGQSEAISKVLRMMPCGVYVVTTRDERGPHGMTASWVMQVSLEPRLVVVAVERNHLTREIIAKSRGFAVNLLPKGRADIAERCFTPAARLGHVPPFPDYMTDTTGAPLLNDAIGALECRVGELVETGDHTLFVGLVVGAHLRSEEAPLTLDDVGWHYGK